MGLPQGAWRRGATLDRRLVALSYATVLLASLAAAATALAWRHPTPSERRAITKAVVQYTEGPRHLEVRASDIRVSAVGPWASATNTIYMHHKIADSAEDILHLIRGTWKVASVGTAGEWCVMPTRDQRNLGFGPGYPCHR